MTEKMPRLCEIRLSAFKSFKDALVPVSPVTFLTGLNSSGKSNVLDGLEVLARLAVLHDFEWGEAFLDSFLNGAGTGQPWPELAQARLGGGDLSILVEAEMYRARLGIDYEIWTYDDGLRSYAPALTL